MKTSWAGLKRANLYRAGAAVPTKSQLKKHRKKFKVIGVPHRRHINWRQKPLLELRAEQLQKRPAKAEALLFGALKGKAGHFHFNCPQGPYIPDFCWLKQRLIVECDGASHSTDQAKEHDARRDEYFASREFLTIRYSNMRIFSDCDNVAAEILAILKSRENQSGHNQAMLATKQCSANLKD